MWELERLPLGERVTTLVQVMQRLGMTTPARAGALSRGGIGWIAMGAVLLGLITGMLVWRNTQAHARLDLTTVPADALVLMDGHAVYDPRTSIVRRPGSHTLTVSRPGYIRSERTIVLGMLEPLHLRVQLEPSPDTGFELIAEPGGLAVWLDGDRIDVPAGDRDHTSFRMGKVAPGSHVLELKPAIEPDPRMYGSYEPWREVIVVEPDKYIRVHAALVHYPPPCAP